MTPNHLQDDEPPWLTIARAELAAGVAEIKGPEHNARILSYFGRFKIVPANGDETPWCSMGACWVMEEAGFRSPRSARARDWLKWGLALTAPRIGCPTILSRGDDPRNGHIGFWLGESAHGQQVMLLGGNQGDRWSRALYAKWRVLGYRWPTTDVPSKQSPG